MTFLSLLFVITACVVNIVLVSAESDVVVLNKQNFNQLVSSDTWLVEYYAPWCGYCRSLAPIYEDVATRLKDGAGGVKVGKVDCTTELAICQHFSIRGYPTLKVIDNGKVYEYSGARDLDSLIGFASKGFQQQESSSSPLQLPKLNDVPTVTPSANPDTLPDAAMSHVTDLTEANVDNKLASGVWVMSFCVPWNGQCKKFRDLYNSVAMEYDTKVHFGYVDCSLHTALCSRFDIAAYPTLKFIKDGLVYDVSPQSVRSLESIREFLDGGYRSSLTIPLPAAAAASPQQEQPQQHASERPKRVPAAADDGAVGVEDTPPSDVEIIHDADHNKLKQGSWLVEFYAPWCGHCKRLAPTYELVASKLKKEGGNGGDDDDQTHVAKVDCTMEKELCSSFGIRGYPTINFIKDGNVYSYVGDRSLHNLVEFTKAGYKTVKPENLPDTPNPVISSTRRFLHWLEPIVADHLIAVVVVVLVLVLMLVVILICLAGGDPRSPPQAKQD